MSPGRGPSPVRDFPRGRPGNVAADADIARSDGPADPDRAGGDREQCGGLGFHRIPRTIGNRVHATGDTGEEMKKTQDERNFG